MSKVIARTLVTTLALALVGPLAQAQDQDRRDLIYYPGDTEHVVPLMRKLASNVWLDQKAIWTSPFHLDKEDAWELAGFGALTAALVATDRRTSHVLENSPGQVRWGNHISSVGATYTVLPVVAGFYLYGVAADNRKTRETGILGGEALLDGVIVSEVFKVIARRNRPNALNQPGDFFKGGASFPSGHSVASWALASVIAHEYSNRKFVPFVAYGLAAVVSTARVGAQQHYLSDVVAGGAMGYFIGRFVVNTHEAHAGHHHGIVAPLIQPSTRTYGLGVTFSGN